MILTKFNKLSGVTKLICLAWVFVFVSILVWPDIELHEKLYNSGATIIVALLLQVIVNFFPKNK